MSEIINIGIGQTGLRISDAIWDQLTYEHNISKESIKQRTYKLPDVYANDNLNLIFDNPEEDKYVPRQIFVDLEDQAANELMTSKNRKLYNNSNFITHKRGTGSNPVMAHMDLWRDVCENIHDRIRKNIEKCNNLQGFSMVLSSTGGTGAIASNIGRCLKEDFPKKNLMCLYNMPDFGFRSSSVLEPYNCDMNLELLREYTCVDFFWQNSALYNMLAYNLDMHETTFCDINKLIAMAYSDILSPMRYNKEGNGCKSIQEIVNNLVVNPTFKQCNLAMDPILDPENALFHEFDLQNTINNVYNPNNSFSIRKDGKPNTVAYNFKQSYHPEHWEAQTKELSSMFIFRGSNSEQCITGNVNGYRGEQVDNWFNNRKVCNVSKGRKLNAETSFMGEVDCS